MEMAAILSVPILDRSALVAAISEDLDLGAGAWAMAIHECAHLCAIVALYGVETVRFLELVSRDGGFSLNGRNRIRRPPVYITDQAPARPSEALIWLSGEAGEDAILGLVTNDSALDQRSARAISAGIVLSQIPHASFEGIEAKEAGGFERLAETVSVTKRPRFEQKTQATLAALERAADRFVRLNRDWIKTAARGLLETAYLDNAAIAGLIAQRSVLWLDGKSVLAAGLEASRVERFDRTAR